MTVSEPSNEELMRLWESGIPLDSAWVKFAASLDDFALAALHLHPDNDLKVFGLYDPRYKELSKGWLPRTWEGRQKKLATITQNERIHVLREICAGYLWAIGSRTLPNGSDELVLVPRQYFFFDEASERGQRPDIDWTKSALTVGGTSHFDIRVVRAPVASEERVQSREEPSATKVTPDVVTSLPPDPESRTGRPSKAEVIRAAIADYQKTDTGLSRPPSERYRAYRSYITSQGYKPHRDTGFSNKTFEKYELEIRRRLK